MFVSHGTGTIEGENIDIGLYVSLSVCQSVCLSVYLFVCQSVSLSVYLFVCSSVTFCLSIRLFVVF